MTVYGEFWTHGAVDFPNSGNEELERVHRQRWQEAAGREKDDTLCSFAAEVFMDPVASKLLVSIFGNSPYLSQCLISDLGFARDLITLGPDLVFHRCMGVTEDRSRPAVDSIDQLMNQLRKTKRRIALTVGAADLAGLWSLKQITEALSRFAAAALRASCRHLLRDLHERGDLVLPNLDDPEAGSGLIVLGMGKLGARELNYSSDIDLIILYDEEVVPHTSAVSMQQTFNRLARNLVSIIEKRTPSGYVFRFDLRLRPDPGATPPAISVRAAEVYYESVGQNWERAAMIKARPVAGDIRAGHAFLDLLRPFMWRRSLDFAAIQDIQSVKRQINTHYGGAKIVVAGHNIKLGRGGIREIEFFAQTQQLIWGGRNAELRVSETLIAIDNLAKASHVTAQTAADLRAAYEFLRRLEHRLQMVDDRQVHELPIDDTGLTRVAIFMGFDTLRTFVDQLMSHLRNVERHYAELFEGEADLSGSGNLVFTGSEDDPDTLRTLSEMGFSGAESVSATVRIWHSGRIRAMRSSRARELLTELLPAILTALASSPNPDLALRRFNEFFEGLPAGIQLFSLFSAHPGLLNLVAEIMGTAPRLAGWLSRYPALLDGVLGRDFFEIIPGPDEMSAELAAVTSEGRDFQEVLDIQRRWANDKVFQIGTHMLRGRLSPVDASAPLTKVADSCLAALLPAVLSEFGEQHGKVPGSEMVVVGYGKLGSREMTIGSDLDLLFIYDFPTENQKSDGRRPLAPPRYYARLCQRFIAAITALTGEGRLYEVDMRLRPAGGSGPIATAFDGFTQYQKSEAWTWEHQALTRARVICGDSKLGSKVEEVIRDVLITPRDPAKLRKDVTQMRDRIDAEHGNGDIWSVKHMPGGLIDIEFIAQYLQLRDGKDVRELLALDAASVLAAAARHGCLEKDVAADLIAALTLWRNVQGILRLTVEGLFSEEKAASGLKTVISRGCGEIDFERLKREIEVTAGKTIAHYRSIVVDPVGQSDV
ncbi:MAG: bifunctional [glutamine synthetase] adenylyltransferase/[glutamine synthetase]-adenylyl-L-tyrosine phosphorylase [Pseudomonadota bacterium]|nr:bifunctional [glutamine synthetase] adenylyltransferase/[glutamine synthetase]-adenylyl-L-tyrosine phosphorylase [Pseudomonadota bacterium]